MNLYEETLLRLRKTRPDLTVDECIIRANAVNQANKIGFTSIPMNAIEFIVEHKEMSGLTRFQAIQKIEAGLQTIYNEKGEKGLRELSKTLKDNETIDEFKQELNKIWRLIWKK